MYSYSWHVIQLQTYYFTRNSVYDYSNRTYVTENLGNLLQPLIIIKPVIMYQV
jgi:hypothetical protein